MVKNNLNTILLGVIVTLLVCVVFILWFGNQDQKNKNTLHNDDNNAGRTMDEVAERESQTMNFVAGQVFGNYTECSYDMRPMIENGVGECEAFEITNGDETLIQKYKNIIAEGNSVNQLSDEGNLIINLPWDTFSNEEKSLIKSINGVSLLLTEKEELGSGAGPCYAMFEVIVKE